MNDSSMKEESFEKLVSAEQNYLRGISVLLLVIAGIGLFMGILDNPDADILISALNRVLALVLAGAGFWGLWWSYSRERVSHSLSKTLDDGDSNSIVLAIIQAAAGLLFLIDGNLALLMLGLMMLANAGFYVWRSRQIKGLQG